MQAKIADSYLPQNASFPESSASIVEHGFYWPESHYLEGLYTYS